MGEEKKEIYYMRMDGRNPDRVLHHKFLTREKAWKRKDGDMWIPMFKSWYKKDGTPMNSQEIRNQRWKELFPNEELPLQYTQNDKGKQQQ